MNLVIVESPTKARTIGRFLGDEYQIEASMGHLVDLPKSTLGVDVEHNFAPEFDIDPKKKDIVERLQKEAKGADSIILATDPDREGEAIASHIAELLQKTADRKQSPLKRIVFHEITREAIEEALKQPRDIDQNLVEAQTARRVLDRLVGYKLSPLLWKKVRRGLSAGRVQSVALRLIVEREKEIEKFKKEEYWTIIALLNRAEAALAGPAARSSQGAPSSLASSNEDALLGSPPLASPDAHVEFELVEINGEKIEVREVFNLYDGEYTATKTIIDQEKKAQEIVEDLKTKDFIVSDVLQKETNRYPNAPFTTSTLQQEAARQLGFSAKRTMGVAQKLYEEGFITYHRTDSVVIAKAALFSTRNFIKKEFGEKYIPDKPRFYKTKQKLAQEAHEAIRPTKIQDRQISMMRDYARLYDLIWRRAVASQMADAVIESTTVLVDARGPVRTFPPRLRQASAGKPPVKALPAPFDGVGSPSISATPRKNWYRLKANGSVLVFDGFLKVNPQALMDKKLPQYNVSEALNLISTDKELHETNSPPRYNDALLIQTLEEKGIGRPSTYAPIISTIESRQYVEKTEGRFVPTNVGMAVNDFLVANFSDIDDIPFTAEMEDGLDEIAKGQREWVPMIKDFYGPFSQKLERVEDAPRVKIEVEKTDEKCEKCGSFLVIRVGRFGKFLSCSRFPKCDFTRSYSEETNLTCPKDGGLPAGKAGKIVIKKTKRGRRFYGCSNYPACDFAAWNLTKIKEKAAT